MKEVWKLPPSLLRNVNYINIVNYLIIAFMLANKQKLFKKPLRKYFEFLTLRYNFINPNQCKFQQARTLYFQKLKAR